jgi:signal peptidase I
VELKPQSELINQVSLKPYNRKIWVTVLLTIYNPGLSLIYNGNLKSGVILTVFLALLSSIFRMLFGISFLALILVVGISTIITICFLVYNIRYTINSNRHEHPRLTNTWRLIVLIIICEIIFSVVCEHFTKRYFFESYKIPATSMANTLVPGDYLTASKEFDTARLQRGDLIIFKFPGDTRQNYIKRLIAISGDKVEIIDKQLYVNNQSVPLPPEGQFIDSTHIIQHTDEWQWVKSDHTWDNSGGYWYKTCNRDNLPEMTVPSGQLFVLGDNRDNSYDSRYWGFLDSKLVVGRAKFIHFSWDFAKYRIRWERIGKKLE